MTRLDQLVSAAFADLTDGALVLAAVSGGADSTALLHLLARALPRRGLRLGVLHLDHGLHAASAETRRFVESLARRLDLPCRAEAVDVGALAYLRRLGLEEAGRAARHDLFERSAAAAGADAVALAHTRDDRAETVLLNLVRGSGLAGLAAMRERSGRLRRPLLDASRAELRGYLAAIGEPFLEDPTNADLRFARNRLRHRLMPALLDLNPRAPEALARAAGILAEEDAYLDLAAGAAVELTAGMEIEAPALAAAPEALARRAALRWLRRACGYHPDLGHEHVQAVLDLARGVRGPHSTDLPGGLRLLRRRDRMWIEPAFEQAPDVVFAHPLAVPGVTAVPEAGILVRVRPALGLDPPASGTIVRVGADSLGPRPLVRSPRPRDRFRPLGAPGSRPLRRYLMDRRLGRRERGRVPVLDGRAGIVWVVGHQVSETARVAAGSEALLIEAIEDRAARREVGP